MAKKPKPLSNKHLKYYRQKSKRPPVSFEALPDWLTLGEAQHYLRLGHHSIRKRVTTGEIPSKRFGRQYRIDKQVLRPNGGTL